MFPCIQVVPCFTYDMLHLVRKYIHILWCPLAPQKVYVVCISIGLPALMLKLLLLCFGGVQSIYPISSMYGIFSYIRLNFIVNVGKYTIHGYNGLFGYELMILF